MATLMDMIMGEYRSMPAGSPDYTLGNRRTMMQPGGQFNDAGNLGNMGMRQSMRAQAPTGTEPMTPGMGGLRSTVGGNYNDVNNVPYTPPRFSMPPSTTGRGDYNDVFNAPYTPPAAPMAAAPMPPRIPGGQTRSAREPGFFERIFGGTQYQSNNMPVNMMPQGPMADTGAPMPQYINYGDPNNAADFFRADQALMQQNPSFFGLLGGSNG